MCLCVFAVRPPKQTKLQKTVPDFPKQLGIEILITVFHEREPLVLKYTHIQYERTKRRARS